MPGDFEGKLYMGVYDMGVYAGVFLATVAGIGGFAIGVLRGSEDIRHELCDAKVQAAARAKNVTLPAGMSYKSSRSDGECTYVGESGVTFKFNALEDVPRLVPDGPVGGASAPAVTAASAPEPSGR